MKKKCYITDPPTRVNGDLVASRPRQVARSEASTLLRASRKVPHKVFFRARGHYILLPETARNGWRMTTKP